MRRPGSPLRVALLGLTVTLVGYALFAAWLGVHAYRFESARDRATTTADGLVVEDYIGDTDDIRVRWTDRAGHEHVQRFDVYDTDRYTRGRRFPVAYDPGRADPQGFPADPDETAAEDDLEVPILLGAVAVVSFCGVWAWRGLRFYWTARRPGRRMTATVRRGERHATIWRGSDTTWLVLSGTDQSDRSDESDRPLWQRVMWHPALDRCPGPVPVTVHHRARGRRPAVVELTDGTRLVPLGRLRHRRPRHVFLDNTEAGRTDLRDSFIIPAGTDLRPEHPWWQPGVRAAAVGAALGLAAGFLIGGGSVAAVVGFVLAFASLLTASWALSAPQP
jgi:hypothetical protein